MNKYKTFRLAILLLSVIPAALAFGMLAVSLYELSGFMALFFGSTVVIYGEYVYNTFKLFNEKDVK